MLKTITNDLKEKYKICLKDAWKSENMQDWCFKNTENIVELSNGKIIIIEKPKIKTDFCFGYGMYLNYEEEDFDRANDMVKVAETNKEYFKRENLKEIEDWIKDLKQAEYVATFRKYSSQSKDNKLSNYSTYKNDWYLEEAKNDRRLVDFEIISKEDIEKIIQAYEEVKQAFIKRLDTYLKKYGLSKINAWSYLVD